MIVQQLTRCLRGTQESISKRASSTASNCGRRVYNVRPNPTNKTEAKKTKFDMAEYDEEFFERMIATGEQGEAYLESLSKEEREAVIEAMFRVLSHQIIKEHIEYLQMGLRF